MLISMELIDRYIYAVTKRLPEKQREDIARELRSLIEDMLAQRAEGQSQAGEDDVRAVLLELGEPSALAAQYAGKPRCLIGPEYFDTYVMVLKIVMTATAFGTLVALTIGYATTPPASVSEAVGKMFSSVLSGLMGVFAWVTAVFAMIEYCSADIGAAVPKKEKWNPADLPEIPKKEMLIKRSEPIAGILFTVLFFILFNFAPGVFGIYQIAEGDSTHITIFNLRVLQAYLPLFNACFALSICKEIMKLVFGRYNVRYAVTHFVLTGLQMALTVVLFSNFHIWNWELIPLIQSKAGLSLPVGYTADQITVIFAKVFLGILIFSYGLEIVTTGLKTARNSFSELRKYTDRKR